MDSMPVEVLAKHLICPMCRDGSLRKSEASEKSLICEKCNHLYRDNFNVISFLIEEHLSETNQKEIIGNTFSEEDIEIILKKDEWSDVYTHQMKWVINVVNKMLPPNGDIYALGAGTGFDLKLLLARRSYQHVFASDISPAATSLIARSLAEFPGELGLFASEFGRCPVPKLAGTHGLVFQALHHAVDSHDALAKLLDYNFDDLVIVEPITNMFLKVLARFNLVQRVEYTGVRPDWLSLKRVKQIADERGYAIDIRTWWEIPLYIAPPKLNKYPIVWKFLYQFVDKFSTITNMIQFGSMAAIHFKRK